MPNNTLHISLTDALRIADRISYSTEEDPIPLHYFETDDKTHVLLFESVWEDGQYIYKRVIFDKDLTIQIDLYYGLATIEDTEGTKHSIYFKKERSINEHDL